MVKKVRTVIWPAPAKSDLKEIYDFIKQQSPQNAEVVRKAIIDASKELPNYPLKYQKEYVIAKYSGRSFHYRVVKRRFKLIYEIGETTIRIEAVFDTKSDPAK